MRPCYYTCFRCELGVFIALGRLKSKTIEVKREVESSLRPCAKTGFPTPTAGAIPTTNFLPLTLTPLPSQTLPTQHQQNAADRDGVNDLPVHILNLIPIAHATEHADKSPATSNTALRARYISYHGGRIYAHG